MLWQSAFDSLENGFVEKLWVLLSPVAVLSFGVANGLSEYLLILSKLSSASTYSGIYD